MKDFTIGLATALLITMVSCGDSEDPPYNWGDMSAELSSAYCQARVTCHWEDDTDRCYRHSYSHLCGLEDTCSEKVPDTAEADMLTCSEALAELDEDACFYLLFGLLPDSCNVVWDYQPEPL